MKKILWSRKLDCGHERPTNIAYIMKNYDKPVVGGVAFCRECMKDVKIIDVSEVKKK